ncbi:MAG: formate dehydrogenase accessory sulfurtransferase FdhD [Clostridium perfringens]|nr:formate dehydrogenase accessory sulfurtransferase FdhD [Clostridium perfringens]
MDKILQCKVIKIEDKKVLKDFNEVIVREYPLTIILNKKRLATLLCSPKKLKELAIGFLTTERLIKSIEDIECIDLNEDLGTIYIETLNKDVERENFYSKKVDLNSVENFKDTSLAASNFLAAVNCEKVSSNLKLDIDRIFEFMKKNLDYSNVFKETGGVHCVALCNKEDILVINEDVARHNALDKVIGEALEKDIYLKDKIVILSGRVSLEMILKCAKLNIPIIISKSAPTSLSVSLAKMLNITLVGFVRGNKMNIYSGEERINY